jgi:maleate isomerase
MRADISTAAALPDVEATAPPVLEAPDAVARLGLIALSTDLTSEGDARALMPAGVALHATRVAFDNPTTPENLRRMGPRIAAAAELLVPGVRLGAVVYACTSASVEIGEAAVEQAIGAAHPGVPVVTPTGAVRAALHRLGARRVAVLTPYLAETTRPLIAHFAAHGVGIVRAGGMGLADDRDMARVSTRSIVEAAIAADAPDADALFLSCTALPALPAIDAIERRLGKPVVTSNQATWWLAMRHAGIAPAPAAPGRLFRGPA